ncbi:hypothetical protein QZH41_019391, partial [Actinostola sp. cb2023]
KYYLDVKRREDSFDLTGPYLPQGDPIPLRAGPTLAYDGIHDRSLKHYFHKNSIKQQLQHMTVPQNMHRKSREKAIRHYVDETMATVDYRLKPGPISPYAFPQMFKTAPPPHRPKALRTVDEYFRTRRGSRRRKLPTNIVGKPRRITRRSPPQHVHKDERERIVNMASKLIIATETVALPQQKKQSKGFQTTEKELPTLERGSKSTDSSAESAFTSGHESESSLNGRNPYPPKREKPSSASRRRPQSSFFKSSDPYPKTKNGSSGVHVMLPGDSASDSDKIRYLMDRMNLDGRGTSIMASPRESDLNRPKSAGYPLKSTANTAVETGLPDYSDDEFCTDDESRKGSARTPRLSAWNDQSDMVDMCTQTVVHSANCFEIVILELSPSHMSVLCTQTRFPEFDNIPKQREVLLPKTLSWADKGESDYVTARPPVAIATTGASTADVLTSTSHETQTRNRDLEPKVITYEVYVQTGDRLGAGSKVNVKITLFGEYGNSGERQLLRSRTHRNKFQRGQVDVFAVDSLFLGKLLSVRVGHNETRLGYGWFLDKVFIKEGVEATRSFEFRCNRWLSSRDDDGQIMRDLPLYDVVPASHVEAILPKQQEREGFYSPGDGDTTQTESEESPREVEQRVQDTRKKSKKKSSSKTKLQTREQRVSESQDEIDGFKGTKAENLFDVNVDEDQDEDRFFEPEEEFESEKSEDEQVVNRKDPQKDNKKPPKYSKIATKSTRREKKEQDIEEDEDKQSKKDKKKPQRVSYAKAAAQDEHKKGKKKSKRVEEKNEESENEEEEEEDETNEESEEEEETQPKRILKGSNHLRVITTAISPFLKNRQSSQPPTQPSPIPEEPTDLPEGETTTTEKPKEKPEESEDEEPAVEFTQQEEKKDERPSSAKSGDFEEGVRAGFRQKNDKERQRHRASIIESENVLKSVIITIIPISKTTIINIVTNIIHFNFSFFTTRGQSIHEAAKSGNLARIKELIQVVPAMKNAQDERGMTALHLAASNGHLDCVKWLAVSGVDLADETPTGYTAVHLAAMNGHVNCMMILAAMGSAIGCKTVDAFTPLHLASMSGHIECVKWLLANRARWDVEDSNGRTPLDIAEEYGHEAIIKLLKKFKKELKKQDSTLSQLMKAEKRRKSFVLYETFSTLKEFIIIMIFVITIIITIIFKTSVIFTCSVDSTASDNDVAPSKVSDSGVGGMESEEDNWISDTEEDVTADIKAAPADQSTSRKVSTGSRDRPDSASRSRTDSIVSAEEKKKLFDQQRKKMQKRHSSFLDSIRMDVDNDEEF